MAFRRHPLFCFRSVGAGSVPPSLVPGFSSIFSQLLRILLIVSRTRVLASVANVETVPLGFFKILRIVLGVPSSEVLR